MNKTPTHEAKTFAALLKPYNLSYIARELNDRGFPTSRDRISRMAKGTTTPTIGELPAFADILRIDMGDLARLIAAEAA